MSDYDKAIALIHEIRTVGIESPDAVYLKSEGQMNCQYVDRTEDDRLNGNGDAFEPGCIVGQALWRLGLIDEKFYDNEANSLGVLSLLAHLQIDISIAQLDWLETVQNRQDEGESWGYAVERADMRARGSVIFSEIADELALPVA